MRRLFRSLCGLKTPTEVVCYPRKYVLNCRFRDGEVKTIYEAYGEAGMVEWNEIARQLAEHVSSGEGFSSQISTQLTNGNRTALHITPDAVVAIEAYWMYGSDFK